MHSAAISVRSALRPSRMYLKPWPSLPIRFSAGISRFSKNSSLVSWLTMLAIGRTVRPLPTAWRRSTRKIDMPCVFFFTCASGVVRARKRRRAGEKDQQVRVLHARDPHLLPVDDVAIAFPRRHGLDARGVRAG